MKNVVLLSVEDETNERCVDIFKRPDPDGTWGFEEFRCDFEDQGTCRSMARYSHLGVWAAEGMTLVHRAEAESLR